MKELDEDKQASPSDDGSLVDVGSPTQEGGKKKKGKK